MRLLWFTTVLFSTFAIAEQEKCPLSDFSEHPYTYPECRFYLGTAAYRAEAYNVAAAHWARVIADTKGDRDAQDLHYVAISTLAYLKFNGLGVPANKPGAVQDWMVAARNGALEARRQIGRVYETPEYPEYDLVLALAWYKSILLMHPIADDLDDSDKAVHKSAVEGVEIVSGSLSPEEIEEATRLAQELL